MMKLFIREISIQELLKSSTAVATGLLKDKPVILIEEIDDDLPPLMGDKRRLHQVFLNILSNAAKFTEEGSVEVSCEMHGEMMTIHVKDTGIGISPGATERSCKIIKVDRSILLT